MPRMIRKVAGTKYDGKRADDVIRYIESLTHSSGEQAWKPFQLQPFQRRFLREVFGRVHEDTGRRAIRRAGFWAPRKSGKSELTAAIACYAFDHVAPPGGEIIIGGPTSQQAGRLFRTTMGMVRGRHVQTHRT